MNDTDLLLGANNCDSPCTARIDSLSTERQLKRHGKQPVRHKRGLSIEPCSAKRKKAAAETSEEPIDIESMSVDIKEEVGSEAKESLDDADDLFVDAGTITEVFRIDNVDKVWDVIDIRLRQIKQENCKKILKSWIRAKEPGKQSKYPYNGGSTRDEASMLYGVENPGELSKPSWWPSTRGWRSGEGCRHREPDHQKKEGSIRFPLTIFGLLIF